MMAAFHRIIWIVLDSAGIGELPDAADYGDVGRNTLGHIAESRPLNLPTLQKLGLANIAPLKNLLPAKNPLAAFGKGATHSPGKDTTTGHWEMAGIWLPQAFPVYPHGFPRELIAEFEKQIGRQTLGNKPASGTEIIKELGDEHVRTGKPIVYTSGDSVFQIAAHEDVIPIAELYRMCEIARKLLDGPHRVGRVIARPFTGPPGNFRAHRAPPRLRRRAAEAHAARRARRKATVPVFGIGKIHDIYNGRGVENYVTTTSNADGMAKTHRSHRTPAQPASSSAISSISTCSTAIAKTSKVSRNRWKNSTHWLASFSPSSNQTDLLIITADHGCDPDPRWPTTDHSREYVPILAYTPAKSAGAALGTRATLADMGQTIAAKFRRRHSPRHKVFYMI